MAEVKGLTLDKFNAQVASLKLDPTLFENDSVLPMARVPGREDFELWKVLGHKPEDFPNEATQTAYRAYLGES